MEHWKEVKGYEGLYEVSDQGRVRSLDRDILVKRKNGDYTLHIDGQIITPQKRRHGYLAVCLYGHGGKNGRFTQMSVHRLVAIAFIPNPNGFTEVNHIDEDKQNNSADNLEWCDRITNVHHGTAIERRRQKQINGKQSKAVSQFTMDGVYLRTFESMHEAGRQGFAAANIHKAIHGVYSHAYGFKWQYAD